MQQTNMFLNSTHVNNLARELSSKTHIFDWFSSINENGLIDCIRELLLFVNHERTSQSKIQWVLNAKPGHGKTQALHLICYSYIHSMKIKGTNSKPLLIVLNEKKQQENLEDAVRLLLKQDKLKISSEDLICINSDNIKYQKQNVKKAYVVVITHSRLLNLLAEFEECGEEYKIFPHESFFNWEKSDTGKVYDRKIIVDEAPPFFHGASFGLDNMEWLNPLLKRYRIESIPWTKEQKTGKLILPHPRENEIPLEEQEIRKSIEKEHEYRQRYYEIIIRCAFQTALAKEFLLEQGPFNRKLKDYIDKEDHWCIERFFEHVDSEKYEELRDFKIISQYNWLKDLYYYDGVGIFDCESKNGSKKILCSQKLDYSIFSRDILIMDGTYEYSALMYNDEYQCRDIEDRTKYDRVDIYCRNYATSASNRKKREGKVQQTVAKDIENLRLENPMSKILPLMSKEEIGVYRGLGIIQEDQRDYFEEKIHINQLPLHILNTRGKNFIADYSHIYLTSLPIRNPEYYKLQAVSLYADDQNTLNFEMKERYDVSKNWFLDERIQNLYEKDLQSELIQIFHRTDLRKLNLSEENKVTIYIASRLSFFLKKLMNDTPFEDKFYLDNRTDKIIRIQNQAEQILEEIVSFMKKSRKEFPIRPGEVNRKTKRLLNTYYPDSSSVEITPEKRQQMHIIDSVFGKENLLVKFVETRTSGKKERRIDKIT